MFAGKTLCYFDCQTSLVHACYSFVLSSSSIDLLQQWLSTFHKGVNIPCEVQGKVLTCNNKHAFQCASYFREAINFIAIPTIKYYHTIITSFNLTDHVIELYS